MGEILVQQGYNLVWQNHLHYKIYPSRTSFFGKRAIFIRAVPTIFCSVNGAESAQLMTVIDLFVVAKIIKNTDSHVSWCCMFV